MNKKKATPRQESSLNKHNVISITAQQARILNAGEDVGPQGMSTINLREDLDIMHPAGRVQELREAGHRIETIRTTVNNAQGHKHRCARYVLLSPLQGVTE